MLLIVLAVPAVALMATQFSLRRTMIEPLGVVRETTPVRRRVAWRILVLVVGAALFLSLDPAEPNPFLLVPGAVLILASGPALLPWLMELLMSRMRGSGTPRCSWPHGGCNSTQARPHGWSAASPSCSPVRSRCRLSLLAKRQIYVAARHSD
ncbi:hypothetical protein [Kibdelosporangium philippinense]|uniref:hypothetical protein n=1 Tax=Kibdelosporangium philippinense TaxID=211113 RepID=UPI00360E2FC7